MKRNLFILLLLLFPLMLLAQKEAKPIKVACVGNSITEGFALAHPETESYPAVLQRLLGDGYQVGNFGLTAHTLMMKGNLPYMSKQPFKDAQAFLPDIVTIKLGTNDSKPINWIHKEDFKKDLNTMIDAFEALPSHPRIYLCLPIPSWTASSHASAKWHTNVTCPSSTCTRRCFLIIRKNIPTECTRTNTAPS